MAERDYFALGGGVSPTSQPSAASKWPSTPDGRYADTNVSPRGTRPSFPTHPYANSRYAASSASASTSTAATPMEQPTVQPSFESFDLSDVGLSAGAPAPRGVSDSNGSWSSRQGSTGKKQDIVPWAFDDDRSEEELDDAGPVQRPHRNPLRHASSSLRPSPSQSTILTRPSTPPHQRSTSGASSMYAQSGAQGSDAGLSLAPTTPGSSKKKRNPFGFLRKKSYQFSEASSSFVSLASTLEQRKPSQVSASSKHSSPPQASSSRHPSASMTAVAAGEGSVRSRNRSGPDWHAQGIDEEWEGIDTANAANTAAATNDKSTSAGSVKEKRRRLVRPLTRDRERNKAEEGALGGQAGADGSGRANAAAGADIEMRLDTNFDRIDDIVDTSMRQNSMPVGPKDETLQDGLWSASPGQQPSVFGGAVDPAAAAARNGPVAASQLPGSQSPEMPGPGWLQAPPRGRQGSLQSQVLQRNANAGLHQRSENLGPRAGSRKSSLADIHRASVKSSGTSRFGSTSVSNDLPSPAVSSASEDPMSTSQTLAYQSMASEHRKDSATSKVSARSGVSPKSSAVDLPSLVNGAQGSASWTRAGVADPNYQFPPSSAPPLAADAKARQASITSTGSGSGAGGALTSSNWLAPDSWAVQPDKLRDHLRDEDDSSQEEEDDEAEQTMLKESKAGSSGSAGRKYSMVSSGNGGATWSSAGGHSYTTSSSGGVTADGNNFLGSSQEVSYNLAPRGSQVSTQSLTSSDYEVNTRSTDQQGSSSYEVLSSPPGSAGLGTAPPPFKMDRTVSSRGGALGVAGGAAAAAANMLGLRSKKPGTAGSSRPGTANSTSGQPTSRPGTAGTMDDTTGHTSFGSAGASAAAVDSPNGSVLKRTPLVHQMSQSSGIGSKGHIMRIDTPFGVRTVSIPLYTNTSSLRAIISRKSPNGARAYRLFVRDRGSERPLGESEKPALLQRRRMEQAGYTEYDGLDTMGREDHSYLLRFVYRPDLVPTFDSESFGNTEDTYTHLDLQGRNLEMVPIFLYRHADWINSLDLSGNPMSDVPTDFVQLCSNLRTLRLSNLALKRIPQSVKHSETLTHLDLSNNRIPDLSHIALDSIVQLKSLKVQNNRLIELPSYFSRLTALKQLNVSNNRFDMFPPVICSLPSLTDLDISFNAIGGLPPQLGQLTQLQSLILVGNSIEELPQCVAQLVSLRKIDVRRNLLQDVSTLFSLETLGEAHCEHNSIKSFSATLGPNLRSINLGHNPLSKLAIGSGNTPLQLVSLNLSAANLSRLDEALLAQLPSLYDLILDNNHFLGLPESIGDLKELRLLSCTNNRLVGLPESLGKLKNLRRLFLHNNNLKSLPDSIWHCQSLTSINASSNLLESFPLPPIVTEVAAVMAGGRPSTAGGLLENGRKGSGSSASFVGMPASSISGPLPSTLPARLLPALSLSLKKLRLADNRLTDDVFGVIGLLSQVEILNLSFNDIYEVPTPSLSKLPGLRELYLSGNDLSSVPTDDLVQLKLLRILHINANRLQTLPAELGQLRNLANLDVGNNSLKYNIANWHYDWNWNSNPELRYLNLSGNKRLEVKSKMTGIAGANRRMDMSDFQRLASLRVLGLMDVTVTLQQMPDEHDNRRVRTSLSQVNNMAYGISDALGKFDNLSLVDVVVPNFRKASKECLIGLFEGRGHGAHNGSRIAKFLADWVRHRVDREVSDALAQSSGGATSPDEALVPNIMRRAFLRLQQEYALLLMSESSRSLSDSQGLGSTTSSGATTDNLAPAQPPTAAKSQWQSGASGVLVYIVDQALHVANAGDALAVLCRGGTAQHMTTRHEPFDRDETQRIRSAEGWVSLRGYVNDSLDVSRSFGYYHLTPFVNAAPAVHSIQLNDSDEFIIIASRSLWDQMSYQTAVDIARTERDDLMIAAQKLRDFAISYGAEESIMVMIMAVGDLFEGGRQHQRGGSRLDPTAEALKKMHRRDRDELPSDRTLARLEREVAPPIGQVALVFTDIKNSTSLWETNGGMQSAMRLHNILLRRQLRVVGGYEVKTEGDAFMVSFPSVTSALLWCFNVQTQLLREEWPQEILESEDGKEVYDSDANVIYRGLSVRMGIHWGWPVCENDPVTRRMDYFGPMVNRAARISGAADGGQIMASRDVVNELTLLLGTFDEAGGVAGLLNGGEADEMGEGDIDEEEFRLLHPNVTRDVVLLRRMGFGISEVGEKRLKGLETPEVLNLVYPKQLAGRLATREDAPAPQVFEPMPSLLNIDEIKALGMVCLRLEALSNAQLFPGILTDASTSTGGHDDGASIASSSLNARPTSATTMATTPSAQQRLALTAGGGGAGRVHPASSRTRAMERYLAVKPELLIVSIRDDAPDDELATLLEQLVVRIRNAMTTIVLRHCVTSSGAGGGGGDLALSSLAGLLGPFEDLFL